MRSKFKTILKSQGEN